MSKKRRTVLKTLLVSIIVLMFVGTYSFFTANIIGNTQTNNIVQTTGSLKIEYMDGQNIDADNILPGWSGTKTFTIKNTGTLLVNYDIVFTDLLNTFINDEVLFSGTCTSNQNTCESINLGVVKDSDFTLKEKIKIHPSEEHSYEITIEFIETGYEQNYNIDAVLSGKLMVIEFKEQVSELASKIRLSGGYNHTLGLDQDGKLYSWGDNWDGQLGDGTTESKNSPTQIMFDKRFKEISAGGSYYGGHSMAISENGNLFAWGENTVGQLGDGTETNRHSPIEIMSGSVFKAISAGDFHSIAITENGNLYAWGADVIDYYFDYRQPIEYSVNNVPTQIMSGTKFAAIAAGGIHNLALDEDGNLYAWGNNDFGQLGDGTTEYKSVPTQIMAGKKFKSISADYFHSLAIDTDDNLYVWGANYSGQLGDGTLVDKRIPTQIMNGTHIKSIASGETHNLVIDEDDNLYAWGDNYWGQLGDGTEKDKISPIQIMKGTKFKSIACGSSQSYAIDFNDNIYAWGLNDYSQLGDGTEEDRNTPVIITLGN